MSRILIVDDEQNVLNALKRELHYEYEDVVIADYQMPALNGLEFLAEFRVKQPAAARILLSGHTDRKILTEAINRLEIFNFINKPWREYELKSAVTQAIIIVDP